MTPCGTRQLFRVLVIVMLFILNPANAQGVLVYNVEISNLNPPGIGAAFICSDNKGVCRSAIPIQVGDVRYNLDVIAFFEPRNAYFSFRIGDGYLSAEGQGYFLMSIGNSGIQKRIVPLHGPLPAMQNDNRSLAKPPVLRIPSDIIATLEITVRPISPKP